MFKWLALVLCLAGFSLDAFGQTGTETIWFYRPTNSPNPGDIPTVYQIGGITRALATLRPGEFFGLSATPGAYRFSYTRAPASGQYVDLLVASREDAFIEVHSRQFTIVKTGGRSGLGQTRPIRPESALETGLILTMPTLPTTESQTVQGQPPPSVPLPTTASTSPATTSVPRDREPPPVLIPSDATLDTQDLGLGPRAGFMFAVGYSRPLDFNAAGIATGASFRWNRLITFASADFSVARTPAVGYVWDTFDNGQKRCRDTSNGQFSENENCEAYRTVTGGMFDANLLLFPVMIGGGYRVGDGKGAYGSAGFVGRLPNAKNLWFLRANVGRDIVQVHVGISAHWP